MRFEPNISLQIGTDASGNPRYTPIAEIKNLNSFRAVERAVAHEIARHRDEYDDDPKHYTLEERGKETRGWLDDQEVTFLQRSKEEAHDYRYFPEPDLVPFVPDADWVEKVKASLPPTPAQVRQRLVEGGLSESEAEVVTAEAQIADYFGQLAGPFDAALQQAFSPSQLSNEWPTRRKMKLIANWVNQHVRRVLNEKKISVADFPFKPAQLAELMVLVEQGTINRSTGSEVFGRMLETGKSAAEIIEKEDLAQVADAGEIGVIVDRVIAENAQTVADYQGGKKAAIGRLIGGVMKASGGKADPKVVREILTRKLGG